MNDIVEHTMMAVLRADKLGGYESISLKDSFDMEYWELEQAKLKNQDQICNTLWPLTQEPDLYGQ